VAKTTQGKPLFLCKHGQKKKSFGDMEVKRGLLCGDWKRDRLVRGLLLNGNNLKKKELI
jgi:hypothetical protein